MAAPFRIEKKPIIKNINEESDPQAGFKEYLGRLLKMIPGEVVGIYMIGGGFIPADQSLGRAIWSFICLILVVTVRIFGTKDPAKNKPAQFAVVFISSVAFIIWIYWLGGPFKDYKIHIPWIGSLLILIWSFVIPIFYKGD